ncbi:hypothetical protein COLO4_06997 [Corchorus olitorius]|uniref:Uncharacterized protein n=1 Tax=Corchorus olitorius TaxID=93759 RepID=A0A1R3KLH0_9ROSI|nr:hypothetical protein COLO4_06997 [Corchorus olitorius]
MPLVGAAGGQSWSCVGCILSLSYAEMAAEVEVGQLGKSPAANQGLPNR